MPRHHRCRRSRGRRACGLQDPSHPPVTKGLDRRAAERASYRYRYPSRCRQRREGLATEAGAGAKIARAANAIVVTRLDRLGQSMPPGESRCQSLGAQDLAEPHSRLRRRFTTFGYTAVRDTAAVLLLLFRTQDFEGPLSRRLQALRSIPAFAGEEMGPSSGRFQVRERQRDSARDLYCDSACTRGCDAAASSATARR